MWTRLILLLFLPLLGVACNANESRWSEPGYGQSEDAVESDGFKGEDLSRSSSKQVGAKASVLPKSPTTTTQVTTTRVQAPTTRVSSPTVKQSECESGFMEDRNRLVNLVAGSGAEPPSLYGSSDSEIVEWLEERLLLVREFYLVTQIWGRCFPQETPQVYRDMQAAESRWAFLEGMSIFAQVKCYTQEAWPIDCMEELHDKEEGPVWEAADAEADLWIARYHARKYQEEK